MNAVSSTDAWNEAHARLLQFLETFALADRVYTARLALRFLDAARERHRSELARDPVELSLELAQEAIAAWLEENLGHADRSAAEILTAGHLALLLSEMPEKTPAAFLASPLSEELRQSMGQTLLVVGPDLAFSSMTSRRLDYGPMRKLAKRTWHRWEIREIALPLLFWAAVYALLYWWLSSRL